MSRPSPSIHGASNLGVIDGIPALELLEGLGELHESVAVCDRSGRVLWTSTALDELPGGRAEAIDKPLASLCQRYVVAASRDDVASIDDETLGERVETLLERLESHETVVQFELVDAPAIELSAFGVESRLEEGSTRNERVTLPLDVVILRQRFASSRRRQMAASEATSESALLDQHPEATLMLDARGFVTYANRSAIELLGRSRAKLIDSPITAHLPLHAIPQVPGGGPPAAGDARHCDADPTVRRVVDFATGDRPARWIEVSQRALEETEANPAGGWILSLHDTSREHSAIDRLTQKVRSLEAYVHTVSHDLRSPLVSMLGFTQLLKKQHASALDQAGQRFLDCIEQAGSNMNRMTRDLLELSTRAQKHAHGSPLVDPRAVLLEIHAELKPRLDDLGIELHLPSAPPLIQCERTPLYQLFSNLIGNAVQHMGRVDEPRIDVLIAEAPGQRILIVKDNGRGIEKATQARIFDAFESIPQPHAEPSTGVGLSIVKKIAETHGGRVEVDSAPGEGAAFTVVLSHD